MRQIYSPHGHLKQSSYGIDHSRSQRAEELQMLNDEETNVNQEIYKKKSEFVIVTTHILRY